MKYFGEFVDREDVINAFGEKDNQEFPTEDELLIASYETPDYEGYAFVLYTRDGKLYEVNASHCSCFGLEDGWSPEETSWKALLMRRVGYNYDQSVADEIRRLATEAGEAG